MPRERFLNMPREDRDRLLDVAVIEFGERGFEKASLNEILAKAGLSKGSYYYYFDDKEDLFATAIESATDAFLARLSLPPRDTLTAVEFWPAVQRAVQEQAALYDTAKPLLRASLHLSEEQRRSPRFAPVLEKCRVVWTTLIDEGQRVGCVRSDLPRDVLVRLVEVTDLVLDTAFLSTHAELTRSAFNRHIELVYDALVRVLNAEPPSPAGSAPAARTRRPRHG
jgi:AcrR family transcriptional regulator